MKIETTEDLDKVEELSGSHPNITDPAENSNEREYFLLKDGDDTVGCGYIRVFLESIGNIGAVFIKESRRKTGAGSFLVRKLEEELEDRDIRICIIGVHEDNKPARRFWEKMKYHVILESVGQNLFENEKVRELINHISPKPIPGKSVTIMGKRLGLDEHESTHIFKEFHDLKDTLKSIDIDFFGDKKEKTIKKDL